MQKIYVIALNNQIVKTVEEQRFGILSLSRKGRRLWLATNSSLITNKNNEQIKGTNTKNPEKKPRKRTRTNQHLM